MAPRKLFRNRADAGQKLASHLGAYRRALPVVLGLPRGGVPVAYEIARALQAPLDVCVVRKLVAPTQPELGLGAIAEDGTLYIDRETTERLGVTERELSRIAQEKRSAMAGQLELYRRSAPALDVRGKTVIVADDGIATGGTARAALQTLRERGAGLIVLAVPVGASETLDALAAVADEVVCLHPEDAFYAVSPWYEDFTSTTDDDVVELLTRARSEHAALLKDKRLDAQRSMESERIRVTVQRDVQIPAGDHVLVGRMTIPPNPQGLVIFLHASGSMHSPEAHYVAAILHQMKLATLLVDLLTEAEARLDAQTAHLRFDIPLLAARLVAATDWAHDTPETRGLDLGYFGTSTGAAAALAAARERPDLVHAVVSRSGRPDLAEDSLDEVQAPTLLIVGGLDAEVLTVNRESLYFLGCEKLLEVVPDATHLFEEPGALHHVAHSAARWFCDHLGNHALQSTA